MSYAALDRPLAAPDPPTRSRSRFLSWLSNNRPTLGLVPANLTVILIGSLLSSAFLTRGNMISVLQSGAVLGIVVVGESLVLLTGRIDLSLQSILAFAPMVAVWLYASPNSASVGSMTGLGVIPSRALTPVIVLAVGALVGLANGVMIVWFRLNAFMVTLAMLILLQGLTYTMSGGQSFPSPPTPMVFMGQKIIWGIPIEVYFVLGLFVVTAIVLRYGRFGRYIYAIGGNEEAARAAGIRNRQIVIITYVIAGTLAAAASMVLSGQVNAVLTTQGSGLIFTAFAAAVIGGISLNGGRGAIISAGLGVLFLTLITNVMTLSQVPTQVVDAATGAVILLALFLNRFTFKEEQA